MVYVSVSMVGGVEGSMVYVWLGEWREAWCTSVFVWLGE